jgi:hypothetical protein
MSQNGLPPPPPPPCLIRPYASSQKGGTLIAEDVTDRAAHERRLCDPDGYRPPACPKCGHDKLHVHDYRDRTLRGEPDSGESAAAGAITVVRHRCPACDATWRILPRFLARFLWRSWPVVEQAALASPPQSAPLIPPRTLARWHARLASAARHLIVALASSGGAALTAVVHAVGLDATREELVVAYAAAMHIPEPGRVAALAALAHRLTPGLRVM